MSDNDNPELHAWRIKMLESSLTGIHEKLDRLNEAVRKNACPQPGLCIKVQETTDRLSRVAERLEIKVSNIETDIVVAKTSGRILVAGATAIGTVVAAIVSIALQLVDWPRK